MTSKTRPISSNYRSSEKDAVFRLVAPRKLGVGR
jgi:hypothetical protein